MALPVTPLQMGLTPGDSGTAFTTGFLYYAMEGREPAIARHCARVAAYCAALSGAIGLDAGERGALYTAARIHDVGRLLLPPTITEERQIMPASEQALLEAHPALGARLAMTAGAAESVCEAIRCHHERWDGTGYPAGLSGAQIPLLARVLAVADLFDSCVDYRPYQLPQSLAAARGELQRARGKRLDPALVDAFLRIPAHVLDGLGAYFASQSATVRPGVGESAGRRFM